MLFDDFTTQIQSDEFASRYDEMQEILKAMAEIDSNDSEMEACADEYLAWRNEAFPWPNDEELNVMECDYYGQV